MRNGLQRMIHVRNSLLTVPRGKVWSLNFLILHSTLTCWHICSSSLPTLRTPFKHLGLAEKQVLNFIQTRRVIHIAGIKHCLRTRSHVQSFWSQLPWSQQSWNPKMLVLQLGQSPRVGLLQLRRSLRPTFDPSKVGNMAWCQGTFNLKGNSLWFSYKAVLWLICSP